MSAIWAKARERLRGKPDGTTPLPWSVIATTVAVQFNEAFNLTVIFPYVPFMVASFKEIPEDQVGTYSGILVACFSLGQLFSSYLWGRLSDRLGAKPIIVSAIVLTCIFTIFFGFSTHYWMAAVSRLCIGLANGNIGVLKSYLGKVTDSSNQSTAMAYLSGAWGFGSIIAPAMGGFLANPAEAYPNTFSNDPDSFWVKFPYCLPSLVAAFIMVCCGIAVTIFMKDASAYTNLDDTKSKPAPPLRKATKRRSLFEWFSVKLQSLTGKGRSYVPMPNNVHENSFMFQSGTDLLPKEASKETQLQVDDIQPEDLAVEADVIIDDATSNVRPYKKNMWLATGVYGYVCFLFIFFDETFPLFARATVDKGGLGFTTSEIGAVLSGMGVCIILYTLFLYKRIQKRFGLMRVLRFCSIAVCPVGLIFILIQYVATLDNRGLLWTILLANMLFRGIFGVTVFTSVMTFVNNSVPRERMGRANGVGQSWAAFSRASGPALAGAVWSAVSNATFSMAMTIPFIIMGASGLVLLGLTFTYPSTIIKPYDEHYEAVEIVHADDEEQGFHFSNETEEIALKEIKDDTEE